MTDWQQELRQTILDHCKKQGITLAEQSRRMGKSGDFLNKVARFDSVGEKAVRHVASYIPMPESVMRGISEHAKRINIVRRERIAAACREWNERGHDVRQPWPETVSRIKANPPVYARAWG